jgi:hypothetical protein
MRASSFSRHEQQMRASPFSLLGSVGVKTPNVQVNFCPLPSSLCLRLFRFSSFIFHDRFTLYKYVKKNDICVVCWQKDEFKINIK